MPAQIKISTMNKMKTVIASGLLAMFSAATFACPAGTTLTGGTGANHKGGTCVSALKAGKAAEHAKKDAVKAKNQAIKAKDQAQLSAEKVKNSSTEKGQAKAHKELSAVQKVATDKANAAKHAAVKAKVDAKVATNAAKT